jgi:putative restriction endonuclease
MLYTRVNKSYAQSGPHKVSNGLLLRSDIHKLFDNGYLTVTKDYHVEVSPRIRQEFQNGKEYYQFHGQELMNLPLEVKQRPAIEYLSWHNENVYRG